MVKASLTCFCVQMHSTSFLLHCPLPWVAKHVCLQAYVALGGVLRKPNQTEECVGQQCSVCYMYIERAGHHGGMVSNSYPFDKCVLPLHLHGVQNHQTTFLCTLCFEFQQLESLKRKQLAALSRNGRHPLPDIGLLVPCILDCTFCCSSCI